MNQYQPEEDVLLLSPIILSSIEIHSSSHAQALIDEEISQMAESIRALKTRRNEMSPISKLPPELLCKIFELVQRPRSGGLMFRELSDLFRWTKITHVSRRWMEIALGDTSLWSNITITGRWPEWEQEVLIRSRSSPISLWVPTGIMQFDYPKQLNVVGKALTQLHRITKLTIEGLYPFDLHHFLSDPNLPRPSLLRSLKLSASFGESVRSLPPKTFKVFEEILPNAFDLTSLSLSGYGIEWNPVFFSNLRRLKIKDIPMSFRPPVSQVLSALSAAHNLESLILDNFLLNSYEPQTQAVHLPRLRELRLKETGVAASKFIPFLTFSEDATIGVECNTDDVTQSEFRALLRIFHRTGTKQIRHLSVLNSPEGISVWEEAKEINPGGPVGLFHYLRPPEMTFTVNHSPIGLHPLTNPILQACRILPLQSLETLDLNLNFTISSLEWAHVFGPLRYLKWIILGTNAARPLFHAIISSNQILMPSFRHLSIRFISFAPCPVSIMQQALLKRQEQGIGMVNLSLYDSSHLKPEEIQALEQVAACVKQNLWSDYPDFDFQNTE